MNLPKAFLPRLWSLLRHGFYGSAEGSFPAVLPLVTLLPQVCAGSRLLGAGAWGLSLLAWLHLPAYLILRALLTGGAE